jgi:hypothetical protein
MYEMNHGSKQITSNSQTPHWHGVASMKLNGLTYPPLPSRPVRKNYSKFPLQYQSPLKFTRKCDILQNGSPAAYLYASM